MAQFTNNRMEAIKGFLGIELGSTRIKAVLIDESFKILSKGAYNWKSQLIDGLWSYSLEEAKEGVKAAVAELLNGMSEDVYLECMGLSGMMHGYLAFDSNWNLLVPFRTWQNTNTDRAARILTEKFNFNIPQRLSIAHLYQAILDKEEHISQIAHITTLAGYVHRMCTGENCVCVDEAAGMFPLEGETPVYNHAMLKKCRELFEIEGACVQPEELLPEIKVAGDFSGSLNDIGFELFGGMVPKGTPFAPATGDGGTGMVATNSVGRRKGIVSAGTSIFADIVLEKPLEKLYTEIDVMATPSGYQVAEIHGNNCTTNMDKWIGLFKELLGMFGRETGEDELFTKLYRAAMKGDKDCGGVAVLNYLTGEPVTHIEKGIPMITYSPESNLSVANFVKAHIFSMFATLRIGVDCLRNENIVIESLMAHGGVFKTPEVAQRHLAAALDTRIDCMSSAGEGGPYGMALLAAYSARKEKETLEEFLSSRVFADEKITGISAGTDDIHGFESFLDNFKNCLKMEEMP